MSVTLTVLENGPLIIDSTETVPSITGLMQLNYYIICHDDKLLYNIFPTKVPEGMEPPNGYGRIAICRCGKTKNNPWCDGNHAKKDTP